MTKLRNKVLAALSAGAMLLSVVSPVLAAETTLQITGNGSDSDSTINLGQSNATTVVQSNNANVTNDVVANADSGHNDANRNTGGDVTVDTGDAKTDVKVSNSLNSNTASVDCCGANDTSVLISGNGDHSDNDVNLTESSNTEVYQDNKAYVKNDIKADADSGHNDANRNTGGSVEVATGDATANVDVSTTANANWAQVGGDGSSRLVDVRILGNGSDSDNTVNLGLANSTILRQDNFAYVKNDIDADANSGRNDANRNTGGDVLIDTGDATADVTVDNAVNFNWASVDCGCLLDVLAKIAGNGDHSDNDINATLDSSLEVFQDNCGKQDGPHSEGRRHHGCKLDNDVDAYAGSGKNDADRNTGDPHGDPSVITGNADALVDISNSGNSNAYGADPSFEWPAFDFNFNFSFDLSDLLALLGH